MFKKENREKRIENREEKIEKRAKLSAASIIVFLITFLYSINSSAQCAMCRAVLETEEGGVKAEAVNDGIVYLMAFPYILVAIIGYVVYKTRLKKTA